MSAKKPSYSPWGETGRKPAPSSKGITASSMKLLVTRASLLVTITFLTCSDVLSEALAFEMKLRGLIGWLPWYASIDHTIL